MNRLLYALLILINLSILTIGLLLAPENPDEKSGYWFSVIWIMFLFSINWFASAAFFTGSKKYSDGTPGSDMGILPAINVVLVFYSIISLLLMFTYRYDIVSYNFHAVSQVIIFAMTGLIIILSFISSKTAGIAQEIKVSKKDLLEQCRKLNKRNLGNDINSEILDTINYISYKMDHSKNLNQEKLIGLYESLGQCEDSDNIDEIKIILDKIRIL